MQRGGETDIRDRRMGKLVKIFWFIPKSWCSVYLGAVAELDRQET